MALNYEELKPTLIWKHFEQILKIPHCSGNETALGEYIISQAKKWGLEWKRDDVGNVVVSKKASSGKENAPGVILQGHIDMVCEKNSDVEFDFGKDPIQAEKKEDWISAMGTTLGSDNGIGVAAALALMEDDSLVHGPLELLFTVDEETGLTGATKISPDFLQGKILLNLDSEDEGTFTIGCAGGADSEIQLPLKRKDGTGGEPFRLKLFGLRGGHSGIDIDQGRGNALKWLTRMLWQADKKSSFDLASIEGGNKRNAIPREAWAEIHIDPAQLESLQSTFEKSFDNIYNEFKAVEKDAKFTLEKSEAKKQAPLTEDSQKMFLDFLLTLPHGVISMHPEMEGLVETSTNMAIVNTHADHAQVINSSRSSVASGLEATRNTIAALCQIAGADITQPEGYPGWTPNLQSEILQICKDVYSKRFQKEAEVGAVHAGLECGIIGEKFPGMDMISFGPTIEHPHSPEERVHVGSVEKFWDFLAAVLIELA
ncbi:MAG: aminoacyl-histidine dipeptidase [Candidatus Aminicenantes bacterium]|nr:MAG: aminoacyl-histidine dipeptidase [Candidatus Aminicenantes bacterium]